MPDNSIETNSKDKDIVTIPSNSKGISMINQNCFKKILTPMPRSCEEKSNYFFPVNQSNNDMVNEHFDDESVSDKSSQETTREENEVVKNVEEIDGITETIEKITDETVENDAEEKSRKRIRKPEK